MENNKKTTEGKKFYLVHLSGTITEEVSQIVGISVDKETDKEKAVSNLLDSIASHTPNSVISIMDVKEITENEMQQFVEGLMDAPEQPRVIN